MRVTRMACNRRHDQPAQGVNIAGLRTDDDVIRPSQRHRLLHAVEQTAQPEVAGLSWGPGSAAGDLMERGEAVAAFAETGAQAALLWGPQGDELRYATLWTDSTTPDGGRPTPLTAAWRWLVPR